MVHSDSRRGRHVIGRKQLAASEVEPRDTMTTAESLSELALNQENLRGLTAILEYVARGLNAAGCILWEAAPGSQPGIDPPQGELFVRADWFRDGARCRTHNLALGRSATGVAI